MLEVSSFQSLISILTRTKKNFFIPTGYSKLKIKYGLLIPRKALQPSLPIRRIRRRHFKNGSREGRG